VDLVAVAGYAHAPHVLPHQSKRALLNGRHRLRGASRGVRLQAQITCFAPAFAKLPKLNVSVLVVCDVVV
jgi:hypothetical protein